MAIEENGPAAGSMVADGAAQTDTNTQTNEAPAQQPEKRGIRAAFEKAEAQIRGREGGKASGVARQQEKAATAQPDGAQTADTKPEGTKPAETKAIDQSKKPLEQKEAPKTDEIKPPVELKPLEHWSRKDRDRFLRSTPEQKAAMLADPISPPERWPQSRRDLFVQQPREVQDAWLSQVQEYERGFTQKSQELAQRSQELADKARVADGVRELITDNHRAAMQREGIADEVGAFKYLLAQHDFYQRDPINYIAAVMRNARIDPRIFVQGQGQESQQQPGQPIPQVHPELVRELGNLRNHVQTLSAREQMRATAYIDATINQFADAKDAAGALMHPHFDRVADQMIEIVKSDPRVSGMPDGPEKIQKAYDLAVRGDSELWQEIVDAEIERRTAESRQKSDQDKEAVQKIIDAEVQRRIEEYERTREATSTKPPAASIKPTAGSTDASAPRAKRGIRGAAEDAWRQLGR